MANSNDPQRTFFTFRRNGDNNGRRLVEITAEAVVEHGAPVEASKQSWFGKEDDVAATLEGLDFNTIDVEGVLGALHTNRVATREVDVLPSDLADVGFSPSV